MGSPEPWTQVLNPEPQAPEPYNIGASIIRIGFGGPLYYNYNNKEPQSSLGIYLGPYIRTQTNPEVLSPPLRDASHEPASSGFVISAAVC